MRIYPYSCLIAFLAVSLRVCADPSPAAEAFLDRSVPPEMIPHHPHPDMPKTDFSHVPEFNSFVERVKNLQAVAQRPIVYPDGLVDFIQSEDNKSDWDKGTVFFLTERDGNPAGNTLRDYLTSSFNALTLTWKYDSVGDKITTDFKWHRDDPRTSAQLLNVLLHTPSSASKPFYLQLIDFYLRETGSHSQTGWLDPHLEYYFNHHKLDPSDSWRIAFDALQSKPENFSQVWKLRFIDDVRNHFMPSFVRNLLAKPFRDEKGSEHVIIVNDEPEETSPGEGYISYYVFDPSGKFEIGGVLRSGHRGESTCAWVDSGETNLAIRTFFNGSGQVDTSFVLTDHGLRIKQPQSDFSAGLGCGQAIYSTYP